MATVTTVNAATEPYLPRLFTVLHRTTVWFSHLQNPAVPCGADFVFCFHTVRCGSVKNSKNCTASNPHRSKLLNYLILKILGQRCGLVQIFRFGNPTVRCGSVKPRRTAPHSKKIRTVNSLDNTCHHAQSPRRMIQYDPLHSGSDTRRITPAVAGGCRDRPFSPSRYVPL